VKPRLAILRIALLLASFAVSARGQGTFIYDQQSNTDETPRSYGSGTVIQQYAGFGQSFTPALSSMDFPRLKFSDSNPSNSLGATLYVNVRIGSITGMILSSSPPVTLSNAFTGPVNFFLPASLPLSPGTTYYFEPIVQSGDLWRIDVSEYGYPGGTSYFNGAANPPSDLWFREGLFVPEPPAAVLIAFAVGLLAFWRRKRR